MDIASLTNETQSAASTQKRSGFENMGSEDFLKLLITQLSNQDPFQPASNEEMMRQIATLRDIEMSTSITDAMRTLTGQQKFGSAGSMIGRYVKSAPQADGSVQEGVVTSIRLDPSGKAVLNLSTGGEIPLDQVAQIETAQQAAERLIQKEVTGVDLRKPAGQQLVRGVVTAVGADETGDAVLHLDTGDLRLRDVVAVSA
ncbi:MAG: hypothetical protein IT449_17760 [Phycisphaerales bacterium]|nr:hypothetical protein [Phycisphaerales bacterium]